MSLTDSLLELFSRKTPDSGFEWVADSEGINFFLPKELLSALEHGKGDEWALTQYSHLKILEEEGYVEALPNGYLLTTELAVQLDEHAKQLLELPPSFPGIYLTDIRGISDQERFSVAVIPAFSASRTFPSYTINGPLLEITSDTRYLLQPQELLAFNAVKRHQETARLTDAEQRNLTLVAALQRAKKAGMPIELAAFDTIEIIEPEKVLVAIDRQEDGGFLLLPNYGDSTLIGPVEKRLGQLKPGAKVGSLRVGDKRIVLDEKNFRATREILQERYIEPGKIRQFLENPGAFLNATQVDLDEGFSARVLGIGEFQPHYFGETDESGISWFEGVESGDVEIGADPPSGPLGPSSIEALIKNPKQLDEFAHGYEDAVSNGESSFFFREREVDISDREAMDRALESLAGKLKERDRFGGDEEEKRPKGKMPQVVVDIALNDDTVDFSSELDKRIADVLYGDAIDWNQFKLTPFNYQERGIRWILGLAGHTYSLPDTELGKYGAILADDMGLGKTFMTLAAISEYLQQGQRRDDRQRPVLVVAPLGLLNNWEDEIRLCFKNERGPFESTIKLQADADLGNFRAPPAAPSDRKEGEAAVRVRNALKVGKSYAHERLDMPRRLVLTTYETLRDYQISLCRVDWSIVVFDEAQMIKNPNTLASRAAKGLKARFKLMVTGTPVENSLRDIWNLMDTAQPGHLYAYQEFNRDFIRPINRAEENRPAARNEVGKALRARIGALMLRRDKEDELDGLPRKNVYVGVEDDPVGAFQPQLQCVMRGRQAATYDMVVAGVNRGDPDEDPGQRFLVGIHKLRKVALHPNLLDNGVLPLPRSVEDARMSICESSKLECLFELLEEIRGRGEKVIVFAITKQLQAFVAKACELVFNLRVSVINGDTKAVSSSRGARTRGKMIDEFQASLGFSVIVMSPIAAGVGLTITAANNVIHLERHWNPAKEAQATDRVYRIGQEKDVHVYLPVLHHPNSSVTTFDQNLNRLLNQKSALKDAVVTPEDVQPEDVARGVFTDRAVRGTTIEVDPDRLDTLGWEMFEAFCAVLLGKRLGVQTQLTTKGADSGCDIVLIGASMSGLAQCKFSENSGQVYGSEDIVRGVKWSANPYGDKLGRSFSNLYAISNVSGFGKRVVQGARQARVELVDRKKLLAWLKKHPVTLDEVQEKLARERIDIG